MLKNDFLRIRPHGRELVWGWRYLLFQTVFLPSLLAYLNRLLHYPLADAQLNFLFFCINFCAVVVIFRGYLLQCLKPNGKTLLRIAVVGVILFLVYQLCAFLLGLLFAAMDPGFANVNDQSIAAMSQSSYVLMFLGTVLLVPVTEECLHRGLIYRGLYDRSPIAALLLSTAIFSAIHVLGYVGAVPPLTLLLCFLQYVPAGLCLAAAYRLSGSLLCPILIHAAVNLTGMLALR